MFPCLPPATGRQNKWSVAAPCFWQALWEITKRNEWPCLVFIYLLIHSHLFIPFRILYILLHWFIFYPSFISHSSFFFILWFISNLWLLTVFPFLLFINSFVSSFFHSFFPFVSSFYPVFSLFSFLNFSLHCLFFSFPFFILPSFMTFFYCFLHFIVSHHLFSFIHSFLLVFFAFFPPPSLLCLTWCHSVAHFYREIDMTRHWVCRYFWNVVTMNLDKNVYDRRHQDVFFIWKRVWYCSVGNIFRSRTFSFCPSQRINVRWWDRHWIYSNTIYFALNTTDILCDKPIEALKKNELHFYLEVCLLLTKYDFNE